MFNYKLQNHKMRITGFGSKLVALILAVGMCVTFIPAPVAYADNSIMPAEAATATVISAQTLKEIYDGSVIARIAGRAGASTPKGAKGVVFEVVYSDVKNWFHNLFNGAKTVLSTSSTDPIADLVTYNKAGNVVELVQCKAGTSESQIYNMLKQMSNGKYGEVQLVTTSETAALYNAKAVNAGVVQATNSGITENTIERIANKALGVLPGFSETMKTVGKASGITAGLTALFSIAESLYHKEDLDHTIGNVAVDSTVAATTVGIGTVSAAGMEAALTALGVSSAAISASAAVVGFVVPCAAGYGLYILVRESDVKENVSNAFGNFRASVVDKAHTAIDSLSSIHPIEYAKGIKSDCVALVSNTLRKGNDASNDNTVNESKNLQADIKDAA